MDNKKYIVRVCKFKKYSYKFIKLLILLKITKSYEIKDKIVSDQF